MRGEPAPIARVSRKTNQGGPPEKNDDIMKELEAYVNNKK